MTPQQELLMADVDRVIERGLAARGELLWLEPFATIAGLRWEGGSVLEDADGNSYDLVDPIDQGDVRLALLDAIVRSSEAKISEVIARRRRNLRDMGLDGWDSLDVP